MKHILITSILLLSLPFLAHNSHAQELSFSVVQDESFASQTASFPDEWIANFTVYDQYDQPVDGASLLINGNAGANFFSNVEGGINQVDIQGDDQLSISKAGYVSTSLQASDLHWVFSAEDRAETLLRLPILDVELRVGSAGGRVDGSLSIVVPPGALEEEVTIRAAQIPASLRPWGGKGLRSLATATLHFEPAGLQFKRPISISQTIETEEAVVEPAIVQIVESSAYPELTPPAFLEDQNLRTRFRPAEVQNNKLRVIGDRWVFKLMHFSDYQLLDNGRMTQTYDPGLEAKDANMDGAVNEMDAERILELKGGPQYYNYELQFRSIQQVTEHASRNERTSSEHGTSAGVGASYGGVDLGATTSELERRANEIAERFGQERLVERERQFTLGMITREYDELCRMVFGYYEFTQMKEYRKHQPTADELAAITTSYNNNKEASNEWVHLKIKGETNIALNRSLYGGMRIAVRKNDAGQVEVYVLAANYILKRLKSFSSDLCENYVSPASHRLKYADYHPLGPDGATHYSLEYKGYRRLAEPDAEHPNMECGNRMEERISETRSRMAFREITASREEESTASTELEAEGSLPLPGGITVSGSAGMNTSRTQAAAAATHFGSQSSESDSWTLIYGVRNEHMPHLSDHELSRLFHIFELRDWYFRHARELAGTEGLQSSMRAARTTDKIRGATSDGRLLMLWVEEGREYWYEAGPPVQLMREAGYILRRVAERPCNEDNPPPRIPSDDPPREPTHNTDAPEDRETRSSSESEHHHPQPAEESASPQGHDPRDRETRPSSEWEELEGQESENNNQGAREHRQRSAEVLSRFLLGVGLETYLPATTDLLPTTFAEDFYERVFTDPDLQDLFFETFEGGDFFLGDFSGPGQATDVNSSIKPGLSLRAGYELLDNWELSAGWSSNQGEWSATYPMMVIDNDGLTQPISFGINREIQDQRIRIDLTYLIGNGPLQGGLGLGYQQEKLKLSMPTIMMETIAFEMGEAINLSNSSVYFLGELRYQLFKGVGFSLRGQIGPMLTDLNGETTWQPSLGLQFNYRFH